MSDDSNEVQEKNDDRYQHQPLSVRLWRWMRWMPLFKLQAVHCILTRKHYKDMSARDVWGLYTGLAHVEMKYLYCWDEAFRENDS